MRIQSSNGPLGLNDRLISIVESYRPDLEPYKDIYKQIHANPELGQLEKETAAFVANHLKHLGYDMVTGIGGTGLVGLLRNGKGRTILLRSELDALPVKEETGLSYASTKQMKDVNGELMPVMHACGHDMHMASLLAAAELLYEARSKWSGTLLVLFQPAEETVNGARRMVEDGLYDRVPVPDFLLAQHIGGARAGWLGLSTGPAAAARDALKVRVFGRGGHASAPQVCVDPVLTAAYIIVRLQSIASREISPDDQAVITCGTIQGGTAANIIPDFVDFSLDIRTFDKAVRKKVLASIERIIKAECKAAGADKEPSISFEDSCPALICDGFIVDHIRDIFDVHFPGGLNEVPKGMGSEDFGMLAEAIDKPCAMWAVGCTDQKKWDDAVKDGKLNELPFNHSPKFAPAIEPTFKICVDGLALAALKMFESR